MTLAVAIAITAEAFKDKVDKAGEPYILHCLRVMNNLHTRDKELQSIAVLHDLIEDTDYTLDDLRKLGFSDRVVKGVDALTKTKDISYEEYVARVAQNEDARKVKLSDLRDNSDITRLKGLTQIDFERMVKYHASYTYLSQPVIPEP